MRFPDVLPEEPQQIHFPPPPPGAAPGPQARCASRQLPFPTTEMDSVALMHFAAVRQHFRVAAHPEIFMRTLMGGRCSGERGRERER